MRQIGRIVRLTDTRARGFGFVQTADGTEHFLHKNNCAPQRDFDLFNERDVVTFSSLTTPKGPKALDVRRATIAEEERYAEDEQAFVDAHAEARGNR